MTRSKILLLLAAAGLIGLFFYLDLRRYLTLESLQDNRQALTAFYAEHRLTTVASFMTLYILQSAFALPGALIFALAAGAIFGALLGTIYAVSAATMGATLCFLAARYLFRDRISARFGERLEGINRELETRGLNYLLFVRLVPIFPFFLINLGAGLTRMPLRTFVIGTSLGMIPGGFVYVNAGASLASINSLSDIASPRVIGAFILLGLLCLVPVVHAKIKARQPAT
jgi:uncharacterized membrane protein YdjX (TVP38/TMEM64 family)